MPSRPLIAFAAAAAALALLPGAAGAQQPSPGAPPPPTLSATLVALRLSVEAEGPEAGSYAMRGQGGCQNYGDAEAPNWLIGWSSADGSELFIYRLAATADGKNQQHLTLSSKTKKRFVSVAADAAKISRVGKGYRFAIAGTDQGGRKLSGTITCAAQTL
ncbi:MAG TPA: hypothetical protein VFK09_03405 [Gemmatimonadales bacterium]|jgi:hypothetical protein|nr:hypothetical protein [Gemmatimonadales bacterium]